MNRNDDLDFDGYLSDMKEESSLDHDWLSWVAFLLGSQFVLKSLKPQGPRERPFLSKPQLVRDISEESFRNIFKLDVTVEQRYYLYSGSELSESELNVFKQLMEDLKQYGRLEDSRTIENTAMRWMKQKNKMLGDFGSAEAYRSGALNVYVKASQEGLVLKIPWSTTGNNPCDHCLSLDGELFGPDDFPSPPHFGCQCNDPMADPVIKA